jgi:hypothetical protein
MMTTTRRAAFEAYHGRYEVRFYSALEVERLLDDSGFVDLVWGQTLSKPLNAIQEIEPLCDGHGRGGFVVVRGVKS